MFVDPLVFNGFTFARISDGVYRWQNSTADQPVDLIIKNVINPDGVSSYLAEYRVAKNSLTPGGRDDVLRVMCQIKYPPKAFTNADVAGARTNLNAFLGTAGYLDRLLLGER